MKANKSFVQSYSEQIATKLITSEQNIEKPRVRINDSHDPTKN
jgi:hypothetical protein